MADYKSMYTLLCSETDKALSVLEKGETEEAVRMLEKALLDAEEIYIISGQEAE